MWEGRTKKLSNKNGKSTRVGMNKKDNVGSSHNTGSVTRRPRAKTFTGCWTCRIRKVKCDLGKPKCQRCEKSGLECGGYDIKLRWSNPIQFDMFGNQVAVETDKDGYEQQQPFQRRNISFVRYTDEYEFYEDMDDELSALHSPPLEMIANNKTWIIKKFGVFKGTDRAKKKYVPRKKRKANPVFADAMAREQRRRAEQQLKQQKGKKERTPVRSCNSDANNSTSSPARSGTVQKLDSAGEHTNVGSNGPLFDFDVSSIAFSGHEWISNELKDDGVFSAPIFHVPVVCSSSSSGISPHNAPVTSSLEPVMRTRPPVGQVNQTAHTKSLLTGADSMPTNDSLGSYSHQGSLSGTVRGSDFIWLDSPESAMPSVAMEVVPSHLPDPSLFSHDSDTTPYFRIPTTALKINGLTRFLMQHYRNNVADQMSVVAVPNNPWRSFFLVRAIKAVGDLATLGYTSNARNSLLNGILSISCFTLQSKFPKTSKEMKFFFSLAIEFRNQAGAYLKLCLAPKSQRQRYKELFAAILCMSYIDIVWGTMSDCCYHLMVCQHIMRERNKIRPKLSTKAACLHRIFFFLKLLQDSTTLNGVSESEISNDKPTSGGVPAISRYPCLLEHSSTALPPFFLDKNAVPSSINLGVDALYGLPGSLLLLFADTVALARNKQYLKAKQLPLLDDFTDSCATLEKKLLTWESEWQFWKDPSKTLFLNDNVAALYHHTMSFYNGLLIYYYTMVRELDNHLLQPYVIKILNHITELMNLIETKRASLVPLCWQGFMGGCASIDSNLQLAYKDWAVRHAKCGMGNYWGVRQVMLEVWRRRVNQEENDTWYAVCFDWGMNLILS